MGALVVAALRDREEGEPPGAPGGGPASPRSPGTPSSLLSDSHLSKTPAPMPPRLPRRR